MLKKITAFCFVLMLLFSAALPLQADDKATLEKIEEYERKLTQLRTQKSSLASQIEFMNTQINLTGLRMDETKKKVVDTQKEIELLSKKIDGLDESLNYLSKSLLQRVVTNYKKRSGSLLTMIFNAAHAEEAINDIKYAKSSQENNQRLLIQVQTTKSNFEEQKKLREDKKIELDRLEKQLIVQKAELDGQKSAKQRLLADTQNDEQTYQRLLNAARSEYAAIQGIVTGSGNETLLREVKKGDIIATVIGGPSCNSGGAHLHFIVQEGSTVVNPFNYLKPIDFRNCSGSSCDSGDGDSFNPTGSLDWPIPGPINFNQGYGSTWAVRNTWVGNIYNFHNGIDVDGSSGTVTAPADGKLYKGGYGVGCTLPYVKLIHKDSSVSSLYLHVYSQ